jgi:hypothetical protein
MHVISTDEATYAKYPPGWPAVMAPAVAVGAGFLVNPLVTVALLALLYRVVLALAGPRAALAALALGATNAFLLLNGASWYAHPLVALAALSFVAALWRYARAPRTAVLVVAAAALGVAVLARPQDAVLIAIGALPGGLWIARCVPSDRLARDVAIAGGVGLVSVLLFLAYNTATNGHPLLFGHQVFAAGDLPDWDPGAMWITLRVRTGEYLAGSAISVLAGLCLWRFRRALPAAESGLFLTLALGVVAAFWIGYAPYGDLDFPPRYGPRYLLPAHPLLLALAGAGLARWLPGRALAVALVGLCGLQLVQTARWAHTAHVTIDAARGLYRAAEALEQALAPRRAVIAVSGTSAGVPWYDLIRNDVDFAAPVLFARGPADAVRADDRSVFVWDGIGGVPALWARDADEPVRALYALEPRPAVVRGAPRQGWIHAAGSSACARDLTPFPGQRPLDWARLGPCDRDGRVERVDAPGFDAGAAPRPWTNHHFRSFLHVTEPGAYRFALRADGDATLRLAGREVIRARGDDAVRERIHAERLDVGIHPVSLSWARTDGPGVLELRVLGPDGARLPPGRFTTQRPVLRSPAEAE